MPKTVHPQATDTGEVRINTQIPSRPEDPGANAKLPHERDQSVGMTGGEKSKKMEQAHKDLKRGLQDPDARASDGRPKQPADTPLKQR